MSRAIDLVEVQTANGTVYVHPDQIKRPQGLGTWWGELLNMAIGFNIGTLNDQKAADAAKRDFEQMTFQLANEADVDRTTVNHLYNDIEQTANSFNNSKAALMWLGSGVAVLALSAILIKKRKNNGDK